MPKKSRYTLRPSTSASCDVASVDVAPRVVMLTSRADTWVTLMPGTARSRSPMLVAGEFSIVSVVISADRGRSVHELLFGPRGGDDDLLFEGGRLVGILRGL